MSAEDTNYSHLHRLAADQVVMRKLTAWEGAIGVVPAELDGHYASTEFPTFTLDQKRIVPGFAALLFQRKQFWNDMLSRSTGSVMRRKRLSPKGLLDIPVDLPSVEEQLRIVDLCASVDDAGRALDDEFAALRTARSALIAELLRPTPVPETWTATTVGGIADVNPEAASFGEDEDIRYIDLGSVSAGEPIDLDAVTTVRFGDAPSRARRLVREGDVLVATVRPQLRGYAVVPPELDGQVASTGFAVLRARCEVATPEFVWLVTQTEAFVNALSRKATGSNYPAVRAADVAAQPVFVPTLEQQNRMARLTGSVDEASAALVVERHAVDRTRAAVLDDLLSGRRRLNERYEATMGDMW